MPAGRIASYDEFRYFKPQLLFSLCYNPNISLVTIIDRIWVRILWSKTIVNGEDGDAKFQCPLSRVVLMST